MALTGPEVVLYEKKGAIATITVNRSERLNALSMETYQRLREVEADFAQDDALRVAIITGAGDRAFSAGMDLRDFAERAARGEARMEGYGLGQVDHWKPTIAAINGYAYGGGLELALTCDVRIAAENARLGLPEVKRGLFPVTGVYDLPRLIGRAAALYLCLTGEDIDAQEALRLGLVSQVVPQGELLERAVKLAEGICLNGPMAVQAAKRIIKVGGEMPLTEAQRWGQPFFNQVFDSEDAQEGAEAFAQRRQPNFQGR